MTSGVMPSCGTRTMEHIAAPQRRTLAAADEKDFGSLLESVTDQAPGEPSPEGGDEAGEMMELGVMEMQQGPSPLSLFSMTPPAFLPVPDLEAKPPPVIPAQSLTHLLVAGALPHLSDPAGAADPLITGAPAAPANEEYPIAAVEPQPDIFLELEVLSASLGSDQDGGQAKPGTRDEASPTVSERERPSGVDDLRPLAAADGKTASLPDVPPALQIISKLSELMERPSGDSPPLPAPQTLRMAGDQDLPRPELRALRIRLQPEELGEVEVTLRRAGHETKVLIAVTSKAAAEQLSRDLTLLEDRLGSLLTSGAVQTVSVSLQSQDTALMLEQAPQGSGPFTSGDASPQGGRDPASDGRSGPDRQRPPSPMARNDRHEEDRRSGTPAPGIRIV